MPETRNGYTNGNGNHTYEMEDNASFLFTSESVGEGHPGKLLIKNNFKLFESMDSKSLKFEINILRRLMSKFMKLTSFNC